MKKSVEERIKRGIFMQMQKAFDESLKNLDPVSEHQDFRDMFWDRFESRLTVPEKKYSETDAGMGYVRFCVVQMTISDEVAQGMVREFLLDGPVDERLRAIIDAYNSVK